MVLPALSLQGERPWYPKRHKEQNTYAHCGQDARVVSLSISTGDWQVGRGQNVTSDIVSKLVCNSNWSYLANNSGATRCLTCK